MPYICTRCNIVHLTSQCYKCDRDNSGNPLRCSAVIGDTYYVINDENLRGRTGTLTIPEGVRFIKRVFGINAFEGCKMTQIALPSTLEFIPEGCFKKCRHLKKVVIPGNVKVIEDSAFEHCENLEEVIISEGVEQIYANVFYGCFKLKTVTLPSTLTRIGSCAFEPHAQYKVILPRNLIRIAWDAFRRSDFFVSAHSSSGASVTSSTEQCFLKERVQYELSNYPTGLAFKSDNEEVIVDGRLIYWNPSAGRRQSRQGDIVIHRNISISEQVTSIAGYAFADCPSIEQVSFPDSVKEIEPYAFYGCTHLTELSFGTGLEKIGSMAFSGVKKTLVELPASIKEIAPDAFGADCVLAVDGDMPFYAPRRKALDVRAQGIAAKEKAIADAQALKRSWETQLKAHTRAVPAEFLRIAELEAQIEEIEGRKAAYNAQAESKKSAHEQFIRQCEAEINALSKQRKRCFFLAISKRKALLEQIESKQGEHARLLGELKELEAAIAAEQQRFRDELRPIEVKLDKLLNAQQQWTDKKSVLMGNISDIDTDIQKRQHELDQLRAQFSQDETALTEERNKWLKAKNALLQAQRNQALRSEKENILSRLCAPTLVRTQPYSYTPRKAMAEESLLNVAFWKAFAEWEKFDHATKHNQYIADHTAELNRVREINALLGLAEDSDIAQYKLMAVSDKPKSLPERFATISAFFAKTQEWALFKQAMEPFTSAKCPKTNPFDHFFAGADYVRLSIQDAQLLLFPYCIVRCESKKPLRVFSYDQAVLTISHTEQTNEFRVLPPHAELIGERHMYLNQDGSVDRRHKNNPILKTVRYSTATISCAKETVKLLFDSLAEATAFEEAFTAYQRFLTDGTYRNIYRTVIRSEDIAAFESAVVKYKQDELRRIEEEKKRVEAARIAAEEAEKQREAERIAAEKAAEERRLAIIRRQKEANEERKRQEAERKRAHSLFEDVAEESDVSVQSEQSADALVEITSNRLISNNVFKVNCRLLRTISDGSAVCYFVATDGSLISNKRKMPNGEIGTEASVGFVLTSGVDYTQMKSCTLRVEVDGIIVDKIDFKMNVSFYSDF